MVRAIPIELVAVFQGLEMNSGPFFLHWMIRIFNVYQIIFVARQYDTKNNLFHVEVYHSFLLHMYVCFSQRLILRQIFFLISNIHKSRPIIFVLYIRFGLRDVIITFKNLMIVYIISKFNGWTVQLNSNI